MKSAPEKKLPIRGAKLIATAANDITIENYSNVLDSHDPTIEKKGSLKGLALYDEVMLDGRCGTVLRKRRGKVVRREWEVVAANDEAQNEAAADLVREALQALPFDQICSKLLGATLKGFAVSEIVWHVNANAHVVPKNIISHNQQRFRFDRKWKPRLLTREDGIEGIKLPERKFIVHRFDTEGNNPYGLGLGATLFWHVLFKREGVAFWMRFLEKFGSPIPFGKHVQGALDADTEKLLKNLIAMVQSGALVAPIGTEVEFLEAKVAGDGTYENWCRYWDEQSSEAVLGSTLSTNVKGQGARAASETHQEESELVADDDADLLSGTLNESLVRWIVEANMPNATPPTVWRPRPKNMDKEEEQKRKRHDRQRAAITVLSLARRQGFEPKDVGSWLGDVMQTEMVPVAVPPAQGPNNNPGNPSFADADPHPVDHLIEQLATLAGDETDGWLERIKNVLVNAEDYQAAQRGLLELAGSINVDPAGKLLGDAFALAEIQGRLEVLDFTGITPGDERNGGKGSKSKGSKKN